MGTEAYTGVEGIHKASCSNVLLAPLLLCHTALLNLSIIQFLMEKHHECRGDVAQTCLCGWDCLLRSFHQCSPFLRDNVKNILEDNALTNNQLFERTPSDENKKGEELLIHSPCLPGPTCRHRLRSKTIKKTKMHCEIDREIALNLFSIFTEYNICNVIYIVNFCSYISALLQQRLLS